MNKFETLNKKLEEFQKKFTEEGSILFQQIAKEIFDTYPAIKSFSWRQYTPYFSDGDECVFRVSNVDMINGYDEYDDRNNEGNSDLENIYKNYSWDKEKSDPRAYEIVTSIRDFINDVPEQILKSVYGDHCRVTLYSDGRFDVDEYDHD